MIFTTRIMCVKRASRLYPATAQIATHSLDRHHRIMSIETEKDEEEDEDDGYNPFIHHPPTQCGGSA